jgi:tetratricopeptide (TPR) repeat protein
MSLFRVDASVLPRWVVWTAVAAGILLFPAISWGEGSGGNSDARHLSLADDHAASMNYFEKQGNIREAIHHGRTAVNYYLGLGRRRTAGRILQRVSSLLLAVGIRSSAIHEIQRAIALQREIEDEVGLAISLGSLGLLKATGTRPEEGRADFLKGLDIALSKGYRGARRLLLQAAGKLLEKLDTASSPTFALSFLKELATRCAGAGLYARAEDYIRRRYRKALEAGLADPALDAARQLEGLSRKRKYDFGVAEAYKSRGLAFLATLSKPRREGLAAARKAFAAEREIRQDIDDLMGLAWSLNNLGYVLILLGEYAGAEGHLRQALDIFREIHLADGASKVLNNLIDLAEKKEDAEAKKLYRSALVGIWKMQTHKTRFFEFTPKNRRLAYYMFYRCGDDNPVVEVRMEGDHVLFVDVPTGEVFTKIPLRFAPAKVTISAPGLVKLFQRSPDFVARSVFFVLGRRYIKYGESLLFLRSGDRAYSIRDNRLILLRENAASLEGRDVADRWSPTGTYPSFASPHDALATMVEAINRGVKVPGSRTKKAVVDEKAWEVFQESLTHFIRQEIDRESFVGTSEKRADLPLGIQVFAARELRPGWVSLAYRYVPLLGRTKLKPQEAAALMKKQGLEGKYKAFFLSEGKTWRVDFLAGQD